MRAVDENGIGPLVGAFLAKVASRRGIMHVSLDVDFLDPEIAPGVGTTVPGGASFARPTLSWKCCTMPASSAVSTWSS